MTEPIDEPINKSITDEHLSIIIAVAEQIGPKYIFPGREREDMVQEAILIGLAVMPKYDRALPLENFMRFHVSRRMRNYVRDNYYRYEKTTDPDKAARLAESNRVRQNLMSPVDIDEVAHTIITHNVAHNDVAYDELIERIEKHLPARLRSDFLRMINEVSIPAVRKDAVRAAIQEILEEKNEE